MDRAIIRKDGVVAYELICAIPHTLSLAAQIDIAREHADYLRRVTGCAVSWALHRKGEGDERNTHIRFLLTPMQVDDQGKMAAKKAIIFNRKQGGRELIAGLCGAWQDTVNASLAAAGRHERLDLRTLADQGITGEAQKRILKKEYRRAKRDEINNPQYNLNKHLQTLRTC